MDTHDEEFGPLIRKQIQADNLAKTKREEAEKDVAFLKAKIDEMEKEWREVNWKLIEAQNRLGVAREVISQAVILRDLGSNVRIKHRQAFDQAFERFKNAMK